MQPQFIQLAGRAFSAIASEATLIALLLQIEPKTGLSGWGVAGVTVSLVLSASYIVSDGYSTIRNSPRRYRGGRHQETRINRFMHKWIRDGGRVAIFSRDLSWVDPQMEELLIQKAKKSDLTLVTPNRVALTDRLERCGAEILHYPHAGYAIKSRFTLVNCGRQGAEVAIGRRSDGAHLIERFREGDHPAFALAEDLLEIVRRIPQR